MVNKVILVGHLGADPQVKYTEGGKAIANFNIATNTTYGKKGEDKATYTEWHRVVAFGKLAEICETYLLKGMLVYICGRLQTRKWVDKEGAEHYMTTVVANEMKILSSKKGNREEYETQSQGDRQPEEDDVPF